MAYLSSIVLWLPLLAGVYGAIIVLARRVGGSAAVWIVAILAAAYFTKWSRFELAAHRFGSGAVLGFAALAVTLGPAYAVERAARKSPAPSYRRLFGIAFWTYVVAGAVGWVVILMTQ
jgi:hypothetical protein